MHKVKGHTRNGVKVSGYTRGKGNKHVSTKRLSKPKLVAPKGWTVTFRYSKKPKDVEVVKVISTSYMKAFDEALEEKLDKRYPIEVKIVDPSIGEVLSWAGRRIKGAGKAVGKASKVVAGKSYAYAKEKGSEYRQKKLIEQAYSENPAEKYLARSKLKKKYPHVWDLMDVSHPNFGTGTVHGYRRYG